jgi:hypothetical protein
MEIHIARGVDGENVELHFSRAEEVGFYDSLFVVHYFVSGEGRSHEHCKGGSQVEAFHMQRYGESVELTTRVMLYND